MTFHFRSRLWHHVSIPTEVDGFVIPSPTWLPRFVHVLLHSLSLSLPLLSIFSFFSPPQRRSLSRQRARSLSRRLLSPLLSGTRACVTGGGGDFSFLSSLLALFFSSLPLSSPLFITRGRNRFSLSHNISLFFSSFSLSLPLFLSSLPSLPLFPRSPPQRQSLSQRRARSLSQRLLSPLLSGMRACIIGGGEERYLLHLIRRQATGCICHGHPRISSKRSTPSLPILNGFLQLSSSS